MTPFPRLAACAALLGVAMLTACNTSRPQSTNGVPNKDIKPDDAYYNYGGNNDYSSIHRQSYDHTPN